MKYLLILVILACGVGLALGTHYYRVTKLRNSLLKSAGNHDSLTDYYNTSKQLNTAAAEESSVSFIAVGDIMLSRAVAGTIARNNKDSTYPYHNLRTELLATDFNFGNLESPFSKTNDYNPITGFVFNTPAWALPGLVQHNFKVLNLANNHAMDQGKAGIDITRKYLTDNAILSTGTGDTLDAAWEPQIITTKGIRIAFIGASYSSVNDGGANKNNYVARIEDTERLIASIAKARTMADFIVVSMHAGTEYQREPNQSQVNFARTAIDAGADLIIGAHPHWIQTIEQYNGKYIFYSLGNFIFDQGWSQDTKEGLMLKININKPARQSTLQGTLAAAHIKQIELMPVIIENNSTPRLATETEKASIFKKSVLPQM